MAWDTARRCALGVVVLAGCLPDNPEGGTGTDSNPSTTATDTETGNANAMLGCPAGETCPLLFVSQALDDRIEIFAPRSDAPYRGAIVLDLKPGTDPSAGVATLDEPYGLSLSGGYLHAIVGHYPMRTSGSMVSFPMSFLDQYEVGATIPVTDYFTGTFGSGVVHSNFAELEPIFLYDDEVQGRLLIGVFNNDLFAADTDWTGIGRLIVADAADPATFATVDLSGLQGGDCTAASEITLLTGTQAAVACDGNEAIAFVNLGMIGTGDVDAAAAAIGGSLCEIPGPRDNKRVRYLAHDGVGGVLLTYGPTPLDAFSDGLVYQMSPDCQVAGPVQVGTMGAAQLGEIVPFSPTSWLVASGSNVMNPARGVFVIEATGGTGLQLCGPIGGFDAAWTTGGQSADPVALALSSDGTSLAVGAAPYNGGDDQLLGKVLWADLTGTEDPCTMTATVTDLTDGAPGHAPAANPGDPTTWRRAPNVAVLAEVRG